MIRLHRLALPLAFICIATIACGNKPQGEASPGAAAQPSGEQPGQRANVGRCSDLPSAKDLKDMLRKAPGQAKVGGLMDGKMEWAAVVNRAGEICATAVATDDPASAWPGSQGIAKAKAYTANAFSTDETPMSTARLYTLGQPGHSLFGIANGNPLNVACLGTPADSDKSDGKVCGGTIAFGGGVPLYKGKTRVGALGVSGDTACADHEIAKRIRQMTGLVPGNGNLADDIQFKEKDGNTIYAHPICPNTYRNGEYIGDEKP